MGAARVTPRRAAPPAPRRAARDMPAARGPPARRDTPARHGG